MRRSPRRRLRGAVRAALAADEYAARVRVGFSDETDPPRRTLPIVLLMLTFTAGLVDAVSYLGLGRVFSAIQTGNLVVLGFALAGTGGFSVAGPALSLGAFFAGAALGGRLATALGERHRRWFALALALEALLVGLAAVAAVGLRPGVVGVHGLAVIGLLAAAMGLRSATIRRLSAPEVTTTVLTSTITSLATDAGNLQPALGRHGWQLATIAARLAGAVAGALLVRESLVLPFVLVAASSALAAAGYVAPVLLRRRRERTGARGAGPPQP